MIGLFTFFFVTLTIATEYEVEYAISSQYPTEWKKRGTIKCGEKRCILENEKGLEFRSGKEDTYYIKIGDVYTSIPLNHLTNNMIDKLSLRMNGDKIEEISYGVIKESSQLTTYVYKVQKSDFPKVKAEIKEPPKPEKSWIAKNWYWLLLGAIVLMVFSG